MKSATVTLYVLRNADRGRRYVGITSDLPRRIKEHAAHRSKGGQQLGTFSLIHTETFDGFPDARAREKFLKSGRGRRWLDERFA